MLCIAGLVSVLIIDVSLEVATVCNIITFHNS